MHQNNTFQVPTNDSRNEPSPTQEQSKRWSEGYLCEISVVTCITSYLYLNISFGFLLGKRGYNKIMKNCNVLCGGPLKTTWKSIPFKLITVSCQNLTWSPLNLNPTLQVLFMAPRSLNHSPFFCPQFTFFIMYIS